MGAKIWITIGYSQIWHHPFELDWNWEKVLLQEGVDDKSLQ
jgi:hypothetical protein